MQYKITKPVRLIETFSGYGSQAMALKRLGVSFEHWRTSEWEIHAVASYKAVHMPDDNKDYSTKIPSEKLANILYNIGISNDGKEPMPLEKIQKKNEKWQRKVYNNFVSTHNIGSIVNRKAKNLGIVDTDKYCYILSYSFPCQDLSLAGKQRGMDKGSSTRSALLWEIERLLSECKDIGEMPEVLLMENVAAIHNKKNMPNFQLWLNTLDELGYKSVWFDMNAKDYGIPQNRQRTFCLSILKSCEGEYIPPKPYKLKRRLKDILEKEVDQKYYINTERARNLIGDLIDKGVLPTSEIKEGVDLSTKNPELREISTCIKSRYDAGITNFQQDNTGVIEKKHRNYRD